jgi:hypothetical protein
MAKCLVVFITSLVVPVFIAGCLSIQPERAEHAEPESLKLEPVEAKPNAVESDDIIPYSGISNQLESDKVESIELELDNAEPVIVKQNEPEQPKVAVEEVAPAELGPSGVELAIKPAVSFYGKYAEVLKDFVDDKGMVDYTTLRRQRLKLKALLREFENLEPNEYGTWTKENKIAFWLNAYNIQMLKIITDNYPIRSSRILRLYPGWGPNSILHIKGIWTDYKFLVMDEEFTLSEIDKRFFRKEFNDPRIYFALSRGSLSSPPLRNEPYYGHRLNKQLDDQVKKFLSSPLALHIDTEKQRVYLSSLFQSSSYGKEFIGKFAINKKFKDHEPTTRAVLNFITNYVSRDIVSFLEVGNYSVKYMKYDWTINDGS